MILIRLSQSNSRHPRSSKVSWLNLCKSKKMRVVTLRNIYGGSTMFFRRKKYRLVSQYESFLIFQFFPIIAVIVSHSLPNGAFRYHRLWWFLVNTDTLERCQVSKTTKSLRYMPGIACFERLYYWMVTIIYRNSRPSNPDDDITKRYWYID